MYVLCGRNIGEQTSAYDHGAPLVGGTRAIQERADLVDKNNVPSGAFFLSNNEAIDVMFSHKFASSIGMITDYKEIILIKY